MRGAAAPEELQQLKYKENLVGENKKAGAGIAAVTPPLGD